MAIALPMVTVAASKFECKDADSCQARMQVLVEKLSDAKDDMRGKQATLSALEDLRTGILSGKRIELPSAQRQHLEKGSPLISEVSFDARHRPISTNVSRHFKPLRSIATDREVRFHAFLQMKKSSSNQKAGPGALLVVVDVANLLSIFDFDGGELLKDFDLGHGDREVTQLVLPASQDNHFVLTADVTGDIRVHNLKIVGKKEKKEKTADEGDDARKKLIVSSNFSAAFSLPPSAGGEARGLTAVLPIDRGSQTYFVTADTLGGIAVFYRNGTMKGRVRVTEDPGGVRGLLRSQAGMVLFFSSHSFGFFSVAQIDVQYPPCSGWNAPLFDVVIDPASSSNRVVLALSDGDVIVFSTTHGKSKSCDLTMKFPKVSALPFKLNAYKGHIMGLPTPLPDTPQKADYIREVFFFNLAAMDAGYGLAPSRAVALQASFKPKQPETLALVAGTGSANAKAYVSMRFEGQKAIELFELSLKQPPPPKAASAAGGANDSGLSGWLNWFPKIGVFGIALVGVVIWNVRKATSQQKNTQMDIPDDLDDHLAKLRERRKQRGESPGEGGGLRGPTPDVGDDED